MGKTISENIFCGIVESLCTVTAMASWCLPSTSSSKEASSGDFHSVPDISFTETSVLARAIYFENVNEVSFLLNKGADANKPVGERRMRPLMMACFIKNSARRIAIFRHLFRHRVDPELTDSRGCNSLMYVCALKLKKELKFVLDNFICSFYNKDDEGNTLLHVCARYSTVDVMDIVLGKMFQYSMSINVQNRDGHTPLDLAIIHGNVECTERLFRTRGHSTLPHHRNGLSYFDSIKGQLSLDVRAGKSAPAAASDKRPPDSVAVKRPSSFPSLGKGACWLASPPATRTLPLFAESKAQGAFVSKSSSSAFSIVPLLDPDSVVQRLIERKCNMNPDDSKPPSQRVPLDAEWVETTRAHLHAIAVMEKYMRESTCKTSSKKPNSQSKDPLSQGMLKIPKAYPACLWRKVLILNTASRSLTPRRYAKESQEGVASRLLSPCKLVMKEAPEECAPSPLTSPCRVAINEGLDQCSDEEPSET